MKMMEKLESKKGQASESTVSPELSKSAHNELKLMKQINHENIIKYFENFDDKCFGMEYLCIISEFCKVL